MSLNDFTMIAIINILVKQQTVTLFQWWRIISYQMMLTTLHKSSNSVATQKNGHMKAISNNNNPHASLAVGHIKKARNMQT